MEFEGGTICLPGIYSRCTEIDIYMFVMAVFVYCTPAFQITVLGGQLQTRDLLCVFVWDLALVVLGDVSAKDGCEWV